MTRFAGVRHWLLIAITVSICLLWSSLAAAAVMVGQMVWVKGEVKAVSPSGVYRVLKRESPVNLNDTIITDYNGSGQIVFTDGSLLALRNNTRIKLSSYNYDIKSNPKLNKQVIELLEGGFRTVTGLIAKTNVKGYKVKTPVATIGVRGTDYTVFYDENSGLSVKIDSGLINVFNEAGQVNLSPATAIVAAQIKSVTQSPKIISQTAEVFAAQPTPIAATAPKSEVNTSNAASAASVSSKEPEASSGSNTVGDDAASTTSESSSTATDSSSGVDSTSGSDSGAAVSSTDSSATSSSGTTEVTPTSSSGSAVPNDSGTQPAGICIS